jgi:hypothetical protein
MIYVYFKGLFELLDQLYDLLRVEFPVFRVELPFCTDPLLEGDVAVVELTEECELF